MRREIGSSTAENHIVKGFTGNQSRPMRRCWETISVVKLSSASFGLWPPAPIGSQQVLEQVFRLMMTMTIMTTTMETTTTNPMASTTTMMIKIVCMERLIDVLGLESAYYPYSIPPVSSGKAYSKRPF